MQHNYKMDRCIVQFDFRNSKNITQDNTIIYNLASYNKLSCLFQLLQNKQYITAHTIFFCNNMTVVEALQKNKKSNDRCTINFIFTLNPNYLIQKLPDNIYKFSPNNDGTYSEKKCDDSVNVIFLQYLNQCNQLNNKQLSSWIKEAYDYYTHHYFALLLAKHPYYTGLKGKEIASEATSGFLYNRNHNDDFNSPYQRENINNNVNQNNNNNNRNDIERDVVAVGNNRDWLDHFYMISRIIILFSIVYFYSSPSRFIMVTIMGFLIYLYHNGFFRGQPVALMAHNNGGLDNNNEIIQNNANPHLVQRGLTDQQENASELPPPSYNTRNRRPGVLTLTWIFLSSFFASLVPEHANNA